MKSKRINISSDMFFSKKIILKVFKRYGRKHFGLPSGKLLFLIINDGTEDYSQLQLAVTAYKKAFSQEDDSVGLVIRTDGAEQLELLKSSLEGYKNIKFISKTLKQSEVNSLISVADVLVSFKQCSSLPIEIAKAMVFRTPIIAAYCDCYKDFLTAKTACCVDNEIENRLLYKEGDFSGEPDIIQTAVFMKILKSDEKYRSYLAENAFSLMSEKCSVKSSSRFIFKKVFRIN